MRFFELQDAARRESLRLLALFALAVVATVAAVHFALAALFWSVDLLLPWRLGLPRGFAAANLGVTLLLVLGGWWIETSALKAPGGAERLARRLGAREARPAISQAEQVLCNVVDEVCIAAAMPRPRVMVLPRALSINAFIAGWHQDDAVLAVTQGALDLLARDELQGLVAHECSHLREGDTRANMDLAGMVAGLELVWRFGEGMRERGGLLQLVGTVVLVMGAFGWWAGRWLQAAFSRQREFLADARAVQWTRSRDGLGGVLRKALGQQEAGGQQAPWAGAARHLLLVEEGVGRAQWLRSHPPLQERIRRVYGRTMPAVPMPMPQPMRID